MLLGLIVYRIILLFIVVPTLYRTFFDTSSLTRGLDALPAVREWCDEGSSEDLSVINSLYLLVIVLYGLVEGGCLAAAGARILGVFGCLFVGFVGVVHK